MNFSTMHNNHLDPHLEDNINQAIAVALLDDKTIKGYGRRQHGMNGKDADLDYGGQCVVEDIVIDEGKKDMLVRVKLLRYANICEPSDDDKKELAEEIVMCAEEYNGEWTGSDYWTFKMRETLEIPMSVDEYDDGDNEEIIKAIAERVANAIYTSEEGVKFEKYCSDLAKQIDNLSSE